MPKQEASDFQVKAGSKILRTVVEHPDQADAMFNITLGNVYAVRKVDQTSADVIVTHSPDEAYGNKGQEFKIPAKKLTPPYVFVIEQ